MALAARAPSPPSCALPIILSALMFLCSLSPSSASAQTEHRPDGANWSITIPKGWVVAPDAELNPARDAAERAGPKGREARDSFLLLLRPAESADRYVVVSRAPSVAPGLSWAEVSATFRRYIEANLAGVASAVNVGETSTDFRDDFPNRRMLVYGRATPPNRPPFRTVAAFVPGREMTISVNAYAPEDRWAEVESELQSVVDSFRFDDGGLYDYAPEVRSDIVLAPEPSKCPLGAGEKVAVMLAVLAAASGAAWLVARRLKRRKQA